MNPKVGRRIRGLRSCWRRSSLRRHSKRPTKSRRTDNGYTEVGPRNPIPWERRPLACIFFRTEQASGLRFHLLGLSDLESSFLHLESFASGFREAKSSPPQ